MVGHRIQHLRMLVLARIAEFLAEIPLADQHRSQVHEQRRCRDAGVDDAGDAVLVHLARITQTTIRTEDVLARVGDEADPYERIVKIFKEANAGYRSGRLYLAIAAAEDHPLVSEFVRRVSERRMAYLVECYEALGFDAARAQHWARFAYATFMGNLQIRRDTPELMPTGAPFNEYLKLMIKTLIPRDGAGKSAAEEKGPHAGDLS